MKNCIQIFLILVLFSCQKEKRNSYEIECEDSKRRAQNDFSKSKYILTKFSGFDFNFFPEDNFIALLSQQNIGYKQISLSCIVLEQDQWEHCYEKEMNQLISQKFGESFFDSLRTVGKKQFILKAKDSVFAFEDCDQTSRNPKTKDYDLQFELEERDFLKLLSIQKITSKEIRETTNTLTPQQVLF